MQTLPIPCLCLVTDRHLCVSHSIQETVEAAVSGGVNVVQLREKDMPTEKLRILATELRSITHGKSLFIINDRLDIALAVGADGLHLPQDSISSHHALLVISSEILVGKSVHSTSAALQAARDGANYIVLGTIFRSQSKPGVVTTGPQVISAVADQVDTPILAIGGIDCGNIASVIEAGAQGAAIMRAILQAQDPEGAARELKQTLMASWKVRKETQAR